MIDPGAAVNLLPLRTLLKIGYTKQDVEYENVVVLGFNQNTQAVIGAIKLPLHLGDFKTMVKFHVIDADTSYRAMLGRPWIHQNWVVPSTLHQCLKYIQDGEEKRIVGDLNPFTYKEAHYSDAKFFLKTGEGSKKNEAQKKKTERPKNEKPRKEKQKIAWTPKEQPRINKLLHWGSDSEEEEPPAKANITEYIPRGVVAPLTKLHASQVETLKVFTVKNPPKNTIFYCSPSHATNNDLQYEEQSYEIDRAEENDGHQGYIEDRKSVV